MRITLPISPKGFQFSRFKTVASSSGNASYTLDTKCPSQAYATYSPGHIRTLHLISLTFGTCIHLYRLAMLFLALVLSTTLLCLQLIRPLKVHNLIQSLHDQLCLFQQARAQSSNYISNILTRLKESSKSRSYNSWVRYLYEGIHIWEHTHTLSRRYADSNMSPKKRGKRSITEDALPNISQGEQCMSIFLHFSRYLIDCFVILCCILSMAISAAIGLFLPNNGRKIYANFETIAYTGGIVLTLTIEPPHEPLTHKRITKSSQKSTTELQEPTLSLPSKRQRPHYVAHFFHPVETNQPKQTPLKIK